MTPAELLPVSEGEFVLDLCAAPGGKACQLLQKLSGTGLLYANDLSASRAQALKKNLEMAGAVNAYVTAEEPVALASHFPEYFDKILVDAPCSGEGMFRREPSMPSFWMKKGPEYYQPIQLEILRNAWRMLRPGGMMLFSTCTFSALENEGNVERLLTEATSYGISRSSSCGDPCSSRLCPWRHVTYGKMCTAISSQTARGRAVRCALSERRKFGTPNV